MKPNIESTGTRPKADFGNADAEAGVEEVTSKPAGYIEDARAHTNYPQEQGVDVAGGWDLFDVGLKWRRDFPDDADPSLILIRGLHCNMAEDGFHAQLFLRWKPS